MASDLTKSSSGGGDEDAQMQMMNLLNIMAQQRLREQSLQHQAAITGTPYTPMPQQSNPIEGMASLLSVIQSMNQSAQALTSGGQTNTKNNSTTNSGGGNDAADALQSFSQKSSQPAIRRDLEETMVGGSALGDAYRGKEARLEDKFESLKNIFLSIGNLFHTGTEPEQRGGFDPTGSKTDNLA